MAARIPQEFLDQLLSRVDLVEVIDARVPLRKMGRQFVARCPFHSEKTPSFTVSPIKQFYHCFGCGAHGNAIGFLMEYEHLGFPDAVEELARSVGLALPRGVTTQSSEQGKLIALVEQAGEFFRRQLREHADRHRAIDYLRSRGLDGKTAHAFGIGYGPLDWDSLLKALTSDGAAPKDLVAAGLIVEQENGGYYDRFRDRIMFPIRDRRGRTIAFGGRALGATMPKYMNSPETPFFHKGRELYGLYEARLREQRLRRLLVVEGYMDVVALVQYGIPYAVATLGTATTAEQLERLFRVTDDVIFCFDGDRAGREAAWRALENALPLVRDGRQMGFLFLPEGEDPDSLVRKEGQQAFEQRLEQILPLSDYFFEQLGKDVDNRHSIDGRARLAEHARPLLERLPDSSFRDMMVERLKKVTRIPFERLNSPAAVQRAVHRASITRSPVRLAIAHLLNRTALAQRAGTMERLREIDVPGLPLLVGLIETLQRHPHITNAAQLLTRYEGTETGRILQRLAQWQPEHPEAQCETEFLDILTQLEKRHTPEKRLLEKLIRGELNAEEREKLRVSAKHRETNS